MLSLLRQQGIAQIRKRNNDDNNKNNTPVWFDLSSRSSHLICKKTEFQ